MTGSKGWERLIVRKSSSPPSLGIFRSVTTPSKGSLWSNCRACSPSPAARTVYSKLERNTSRSDRICGSSSTIKILEEPSIQLPSSLIRGDGVRVVLSGLDFLLLLPPCCELAYNLRKHLCDKLFLFP